MRKILSGCSGVLVLLAVIFLSTPRQAEACCTCSAKVREVSTKEWRNPYPNGTVDVITTAFKNEINAHESWLLNVIFEDNILPAMMLMTEQLTVVALQQVQIVGTFFDAKHQMETQRTFQKLQAEAHKDYHPSVGMCKFGSSVKSLAASERRGEFNSVLMAQRSLDRQLGNANASGAQGDTADKSSRLALFKKVYCNPSDNNNGLWAMCTGNPAPSSLQGREAERFNKDIDYGRTIDFPWTLKVNFTDTKLEPDETDVISLSNNLFGHELFSTFPSNSLHYVPESGPPVSDAHGRRLEGHAARLAKAQEVFMDMRSVVAKRAVAENSYNAIVGMKSEGTGGSTQYLKAILKELGVDKPEDMTALLGDNPSYHAQMEVLTKKIYQDPRFYTNLYDKPANVSRKEAALQAIGLMQKFDMFKSHLRSEASLSVLLELAVMDLQAEVEINLGD